MIAHRGGGLEAPENTLLAIRQAVAAGAPWQEVDLTLSRDGRAVVIHDDTLERTCAPAQGAVEAHDAADLARLDAGCPRQSAEQAEERARWEVAAPSWRPGRPGCHVPTLDELLAVPGTQLMLELKSGPPPVKLVGEVAASLGRAGRSAQVAIGSFSQAMLDESLRRLPDLPQVGIACGPDEVRAMARRRLWRLAVDTPSAELAVALGGAKVWTWTVCCREQAQQLAALGVDGLIADCPAALLAPPQQLHQAARGIPPWARARVER